MINQLFKKGIKTAWLATATVIILFALIVSVGRIVFAFASGYKATVEQLASQFLEHPIKIERVHGSWHGLQPIFKLRNVSIYSDDRKRVLTHVKKLDIGIDLIDSLLHWRVEPGEFALSDLDVQFHQNKDNTININALNFNIQTKKNASIISSIDGLYNLLLTPGDKVVKNISLTWYANDGATYKVEKINARLMSGVLEHKLILFGHLSKPFKTDIQLILNLQGNRLAKRFTGIEGFAKINHLQTGQWINKLNLPVSARRGEVDSTIWFNIQNQKLTKAHAIVKAKKLVLISDALEHSLKLPKANIEFKWERDNKKIGKWKGQFKKLSFKYLGLPEMENISGAFEFSSDEGKVQLLGNKSKLSYNRLFSDPFNLTDVFFNTRWQKKSGAWEIFSPGFALKDHHASVAGEFRLHIPNNKMDSPVIDLQAHAQLDDVTKLSNYLPRRILKKPLDDWLSNAFLAGRLPEVQMVLRGELNKFPFDQSDGVFEVKGQFAKLNLHYRDGWSDIKKLYGRIYFDGRKMHVRARHGQIYNQSIRMITADIDNLAKPDLSINGAIKMDLAKAIDFIHHSPLEKTVGKELHDLKLLGPMQLVLDLGIPLHDNLPLSVSGDVSLNDGELLLDDWQLNAKKINGKLHFTEKDLSSNKIKMAIFNRPVDMKIQTLHPENSEYSKTVVFLSGETNIQELMKYYSMKNTNLVEGETKYKAKLLLTRSGDHAADSLTLLSDLEGVKINLPEPFGKSKNMSKYIELGLDLVKQKPMNISLSYDDLLHGNLIVDLTSNNGANEYFEKIKKADIKMNKLKVFNQAFNRLDFHMEQNASGYLFNIDSPDVKGEIRVPFDLTQDAVGASLAYLKLSPFKSSGTSTFAPKDFIPINLNVQNLYYNKLPLGALQLSLTPEHDVLRINHLALDSPNLHLTTSGQWQVLPDFQETMITGAIRTKALGDLLKMLDVNANLVGGKGRATFTLAWFDSLLHPKPENLNGKINLDFADGQIVKLSKDTRKKVGFGRVLNLFSLQSLPKRLTLDFSDLSQKGFVFDEMKGDFMLKSGNAFTENAYLAGSVARVAVNGRLGLGEQDYDINLMITPNVTSSLPVVAAITGGPIAGVATLFAETVVSKAVGDITASTYRVTGSWSEPLVIKMGK